MNLQNYSLARQMDMVFRELESELRYLCSGIVFIQIRNDVIGKFGIRHDPVDVAADEMPWTTRQMSEHQFYAFKNMAIRSLEGKRNWTHGEINFEFTMRKGNLETSVQMESNYNMANVLERIRKIS